MKKFLTVVLVTFSTFQLCFAAPVLHRYTDKATGDERGVCYSDKDGNAAISNPDWDVEVIPESRKHHYMVEQRKQIKAQLKAEKDALKAKRKDIKNKLKGLGLSQSEVDTLVGESD